MGWVSQGPPPPPSRATHLEVLGDLPHEALEGQLADEQLGGLLVAADLAQGDGAGAVSVGLLHSASGGCALASGLGGELLSGGLASGRLTRGLLGAGHCSSSLGELDECWESSWKSGA